MSRCCDLEVLQGKSRAHGTASPDLRVENGFVNWGHLVL